MRLAGYLFLFLSSFGAVAQDADPLPAQVVELATYVPTVSVIKGEQYTLPLNAHSYYADKEQHELIILLKKEKEIHIGATGELLVFDMLQKKVKWQTNINSFNVYVTKQYIITSENGNTHCYRRTDGKQLWKKTDADIKYIDEAKGIIVTDYIRGLNLHTGKILWQRYMPTRYNWEDILKIDDQSIVVSAGGVYRIDLATGKGWSSSDYTTKDEFSIPTAMGVVSPVPAYPEVSVPGIINVPHIERSNTSNILLDGNHTYVATNKRLLSINTETGILSWAVQLPRIAGISSLHRDGALGNIITMVNEARIRNNNGIVKKLNRPYIAAFSAADGAQLHFTEMKRDESIRDIAWSNESIDVLLDSAFLRYAYNGKEAVEPIPYNDSVQYYSFFAPPSTGKGPYRWYFLKDDKCEPYNDFGDKAAIMHTSDGIYVLKNVFDLYKNNFFPGEISPGSEYVLFYKDGQNMVADREKILYNDNVIGITVKTPATNKGFIHKDALHIVNGNTLSVIPLNAPQ